MYKTLKWDFTSDRKMLELQREVLIFVPVKQNGIRLNLKGTNEEIKPPRIQCHMLARLKLNTELELLVRTENARTFERRPQIATVNPCMPVMKSVSDKRGKYPLSTQCQLLINIRAYN